MGFRLYKSVRLGKGVRLNLSKSGAGMSFGTSGLRYSVHSSGRRTGTVGIPGSGVSYRKDSYGGRRPSSSRSRARRSPPQVTIYPKAGLFAPRDEKSFVKGVTAYMRGDHRAALNHFKASMARDPSAGHVAEEFFAAFSAAALGDHRQAIGLLDQVLASPVALPDQLMAKYGITGVAQVSVTPEVVAELPYSNLAAALLAAELHQRSGQPQRAMELLESLGALAPSPFFALSLAEMYADLGRWDDVLRVTEDFTANVDDATCQLLVYRGRALREKGLHQAALEILREALKSKKRHEDTLKEARYQRALTYEALGQRGRARKELERLFAVDPGFADVRQRLGLDR
jgi:tetratricopeptide (TPR) repeat protein